MGPRPLGSLNGLGRPSTCRFHASFGINMYAPDVRMCAQVKLCVVVGGFGLLINTVLLRCLLHWLGRVRLLWLGANPLLALRFR